MEMKYTTIWECAPFLNPPSELFFPNLFSIHKSLWNNVGLKQKRSMERIFSFFFERGIVSYINGSKLLTFKYLFFFFFFTQRRAVTRPPQIISVTI